MSWSASAASAARASRARARSSSASRMSPRASSKAVARSTAGRAPHRGSDSSSALARTSVARGSSASHSQSIAVKSRRAWARRERAASRTASASVTCRFNREGGGGQRAGAVGWGPARRSGVLRACVRERNGAACGARVCSPAKPPMRSAGVSGMAPAHGDGGVPAPGTPVGDEVAQGHVPIHLKQQGMSLRDVPQHLAESGFRVGGRGRLCRAVHHPSRRDRLGGLASGGRGLGRPRALASPRRRLLRRNLPPPPTLRLRLPLTPASLAPCALRLAAAANVPSIAGLVATAARAAVDVAPALAFRLRSTGRLIATTAVLHGGSRSLGHVRFGCCRRLTLVGNPRRLSSRLNSRGLALRLGERLRLVPLRDAGARVVVVTARGPTLGHFAFAPAGE
eukprot:scaffold14009_cov110-Isochrysis_galbana.AAC.3